jgi:integrase
MKVAYRYVYEDRDRHGNLRRYFCAGRGRRKVRIYELPGTPEFSARYHQLEEQAKSVSPAASTAIQVGTYRWLCVQYFGSAEFRALHASTQRTRRRVLESTLVEPIYRGAQQVFADFPLTRMTTKALRVLRDRKADFPGSASDRVKALRALYSWAMNADHVAANPARDLSKLPMPGSGHHTWTETEIRQFEAHHPIGSMARLALALLRFTGVRRSDVVNIGRQHVRDGWLKLAVTKNAARKPTWIEIPILPQLQSVLDATPTGHLTFLTTSHGAPFSGPGFTNWFRDRVREAGLADCPPHGLRKAAAVAMANNGASTQQLMAWFGWLSLAEAERYTREANKKQLARDAAPFMARPE